eukprot:NODE_4115_length_840_cov_38.188369_g3406_i0.p2 GENE.NODE_4115_length_840_cov_38.188369_g3406_i0~~NODE_4115_length_840_cov_38.188369_g3406_i0.p2  ORF type:complete len:146 (-),score=5.43 NODE_4115_length_840_cov_38.188369_g3406_i0:108-545(-)
MAVDLAPLPPEVVDLGLHPPQSHNPVLCSSIRAYHQGAFARTARALVTLLGMVFKPVATVPLRPVATVPLRPVVMAGLLPPARPAAPVSQLGLPEVGAEDAPLLVLATVGGVAARSQRAPPGSAKNAALPDTNPPEAPLLPAAAS